MNPQDVTQEEEKQYSVLFWSRPLTFLPDLSTSNLYHRAGTISSPVMNKHFSIGPSIRQSLLSFHHSLLLSPLTHFILSLS